MESSILNLKVQTLHKIVSSLEKLTAKFSEYLSHNLVYYYSIATRAEFEYDLQKVCAC